LLPPPERRGVVLIDPPFESASEFARAVEALDEALERFANGVYLVWFPIKSAGEADAFAGEVLAAGTNKVLRIDIDIGAEPGAADKERLTAAGLLIVNPPFGFKDEMHAALAIIAPLLSHEARFDIRWLAGGED
jgi:23S rRNA (adenine2030-N6)-methyltransferase